MIDALTSLYGRRYKATIIYMLQSTEYRLGPYLKWYWRTNNFNHVARRRDLERTRPAKLLLLALGTGMALQIVIGSVLIVLGIQGSLTSGVEFGLALLISYPVVWAHLIAVPMTLGRWIITSPKKTRTIQKSQTVFSHHKAIKIAVAGSYGKTTMKELLLTVLGRNRKVAATPENKNVATSHGDFARSLKGDEDILIIEYGEAGPGDVKRFSATTRPDVGIITGVAPAHLDRYKTLRAAGKDIFSLADYLKDQNVYVNSESKELETFIKPAHHPYGAKGVLGWRVSDIKLSLSGTSFVMEKGNRTLKLHSGLIGRHQVGPIALTAALANQLGLTKKQIGSAIAQTMPFEHRMQPYALNGAWIIDDTYNGNLEGIRAGLQLLKEVDAKRKVYVTPGLVDQGRESNRVHQEIGNLIADAKPDQVVLMQNSVTERIQAGLKEGNYPGEVILERDPLRFYSHLDQFVAAGDVVLMQNDWTDNYN